MKKFIQKIEDNANLLIGLLIIFIFIGIIIEIIFLSTATDDSDIASEDIASGARDQRDSAAGEGGLGW